MENNRQIKIKEELFGLKLYTDKNTPVSGGVNVNILKNCTSENDIFHYNCSISENLLELNIANLGNFKVESGNKITITHNTDTAPEETLVFLYGSCMGGILYQRGIIPLHGSAVLTEKGAILFLGVSGAEKSTTAAALAERGYPIISDDISATKLEENKAVLIPSKADLKLWKRSIDMLDKSTDNLLPVRNKLEKYYLPFEDKSLKEHYPVYKIYILNSHNQESIEFSEPLVNVKSVHIYDLCTISQFLHQCYIFLASAHLSGSNSKSLLFWCVISLLKISVIYSNGSIPIILHV